ncbi:MAG TPA: hypothetical protein PK299_04395 [Anaerolineales bacterium]|nr:hypothetical protein [Anaerolineales bacterium]
MSICKRSISVHWRYRVPFGVNASRTIVSHSLSAQDAFAIHISQTYAPAHHFEINPPFKKHPTSKRDPLVGWGQGKVAVWLA